MTGTVRPDGRLPEMLLRHFGFIRSEEELSIMLELKNVKKSYDGTPVLTDISLNIEDGEIVSILGPSGCGKTTLLNLILGIVDSDGGQIIYNGQDITNVPMEKRGFNIVFQDYALFPNLNVYQNITYGLRNNPEISSREEVEDLIHLLGLEEHLNKRIGQLSGGQKQRVALARTMVMKPKILLLDEPLSALDGVIKESIKDRGYAIYPGKVTEAETFRIGNIGEIYPEDIEKVCAIIKEFLEEYNHEEN